MNAQDDIPGYQICKMLRFGESVDVVYNQFNIFELREECLNQTVSVSRHILNLFEYTPDLDIVLAGPIDRLSMFAILS